jgi:hypothetical protein
MTTPDSKGPVLEEAGAADDGHSLAGAGGQVARTLT